MTNLSFALSFAILVIIFLLRLKITDIINESYKPKTTFQSEWIVYILSVLFVALILMGMLMDNTTQKYSDLSNGFEKLQSRPNDRPNPMFDINTYW